MAAFAVLVITLTGCGGSKTPEAEKRSPVVGGDLVVEGRIPGASTLSIEVTGDGLKDAIRSRFPVKNGELLASIQVPPGTGRLITVSALDGSNRPTHRGSAYATVSATVTGPIQVPLRPVGDTTREPGTLVLGSYRVTDSAKSPINH